VPSTVHRVLNRYDFAALRIRHTPWGRRMSRKITPISPEC
jgi:hypothetical protein